MWGKMEKKLRNDQLKLLEVLLKLDKFFKKNKIDYFLIGGSALGAIRHKGFIPWDDDIDIGLYRSEFERMEKLLTNQKLSKVKYFKVGETKFPPFGYVQDFENKDVKIDIFPIDDIPKKKMLRKFQKKISDCYHLSIYKTPAVNRGRYNYYFTKLFILIIPEIMFQGLAKILKRIMLLLGNQNSENIANIYGMKGYFKEIMPRKYIGKPILKEFEGHLFPIPEEWDNYLKHLYGDYMKFPPQEFRKPKHVRKGEKIK